MTVERTRRRRDSPGMNTAAVHEHEAGTDQPFVRSGSDECREVHESGQHQAPAVDLGRGLLDEDDRHRQQSDDVDRVVVGAAREADTPLLEPEVGQVAEQGDGDADVDPHREGDGQLFGALGEEQHEQEEGETQVDLGDTEQPTRDHVGRPERV